MKGRIATSLEDNTYTYKTCKKATMLGALKVHELCLHIFDIFDPRNPTFVQNPSHRYKGM